MVRVVKTKVLISFALIAKLICVFFFRLCKKKQFSHDGAQMILHVLSLECVFC